MMMPVNGYGSEDPFASHPQGNQENQINQANGCQQTDENQRMYTTLLQN
jgi:hypothetical protein